MPGTDNNNNNRHSDEPLDPRTLDQLNAYLDYELSEAERAQVRDLLRRSPAADNEMATLKATSKVLSELPPVPAPRSFAVRAAMLEQPAKSPRGFNLFGWIPTPSFALSLGSLTAACLLVLVLVGQLVSNGSGRQLPEQRDSVVQSVARPATPSSGQGNNGGLAYSNPNSNNAPSAAPLPADAPSATTASAAPPMAIAPAATPTVAEITSAVAMSKTSGSAGNGATSGVDATRAATPRPASSSPGLALSTTTMPVAPPGATFAYQDGPNGNNPSTPAYALSATSGAATPVPNLQANNSAPGGAGISAGGGIPQQNTGQTNNYNVFQGNGMDYWLVVEIALAVLAVALGLGAVIAQRRSR